MNFNHFFSTTLKTDKNKAALICDQRTYTYGELDAQIEIEKKRLSKLPPHTINCEYIENSFSTLSSFLAHLKLNLIWAPFYKRTQSHSSDLLVNSLQGKCIPKHSGILFRTSGSTGKSKLILNEESDLIANAEIAIKGQKLTCDSRSYTSLTFAHVGGLKMQALPTLLCGGTVIWDRRFQPQRAIQKFNEATHSVLVPAQLRKLVIHKEWEDFFLQNNHTLVTGSMPVSYDLINSLKAKNIQVQVVYGLTEIGPYALCDTENPSLPTDALGCLGRPIPPYKASIRWEDKDPHKGELLLEGPSMGKQITIQENSVTVKSPSNINTGDLVTKIEESYFFLGRIGRRLNIGGYKYSPEEIEEFLRGHLAIKEAYIKKEFINNDEIAHLYIDTTLSKGEVKRIIHRHFSIYKVPNKITISDTIEKTDIEKPRS